MIKLESLLIARDRAIEAARANVGAMLDEASRIDGTSPRVSLVRGEIMAQLPDAHAQRETTAVPDGLGHPGAAVALLIAFSAVLAGFVMLSGVK